jgi:uncharacterized membrane-anchored protein YhcB (DUF1043 family)
MLELWQHEYLIGLMVGIIVGFIIAILIMGRQSKTKKVE